MLLSIEGVARRLGVCEKTARTMVRDLPAVKIGKRRRYAAATVDDFVKRSTLPPLAETERQASSRSAV